MIKFCLRAFDFLKIRYPDKSHRPSLYVLPFFFAMATCAFVHIIDDDFVVNLFTSNAFDNISTFVQVLPGFYIASLAAIASYSNEHIDNKISGATPYLVEHLSVGNRPSELSRRRFLTLLFGYLAAVSILLTIALFFIRLSYDVGFLRVSTTIFNGLYMLACLLFFSVFYQLVLLTLFGIYYLADRMHRL